MTVRFPRELRPVLASPRGVLIEDDSVLPELLKGKEVVTVGDVTTKRCLELGIVPRVAIFDGKTQRSKMVELNAPNGVIVTENPPGCVCERAVEALKRAFEEGTWVKVKGEEDLLAIPALLLAPYGWALLYGQPNSGVVLVESNPFTKAHFEELLLLAEGNAEEILCYLKGRAH